MNRSLVSFATGSVAMGMLLISAASLGGCASSKTFPPPVYRKPALPEWQPPAEEKDPLDGMDLEGGDWVEEPETETTGESVEESDSDVPSDPKNTEESAESAPDPEVVSPPASATPPAPAPGAPAPVTSSPPGVP